MARRKLDPLLERVVALLACGAIACASPAPRAQPTETLNARWVGPRDGREPLVVLLHGYGAPGDDLVPIAEELAQRLDGRVRFVLPEAPLAREGGGRAWWELELGGERPVDRGASSPPGLARARGVLVRWLNELRRSHRLDPRHTVLGGFSQGAMLSIDVALHWPEELAGVAALSGGPIDEARWQERMRRAPPILMTHGRGDPLLSFDAASRLHDHLRAAGVRVMFVPFDGYHEIPPIVMDALEAFVRERLLDRR